MIDRVFWHGPSGDEPVRNDGLDGDVRCEVAIVGGGVAGLMCARVLAERAHDVIVIEAARCGGGASGRSSGFLTADSEVGLAQLVSGLGKATAKQLWQFVLDGIEDLRGVIESRSIRCDDQVQRSLLVATSRRSIRAVRHEYEAQRALGFASRFHTGDQIPSILGTPTYRAALESGGSFGIDPYAFCQGLKTSLLRDSVRVFEGTRATSVLPRRVATSAGTVHAKTVVVCTDRSDGSLGPLKGEIQSLQTFVLATTPLSLADQRRIFPSGPLLVWDTDLVYQYFRPTPDGRLLIGGGDLASTFAPPREASFVRVTQQLEAAFRRRFPDLSFDVECAWHGQLGVTQDLVPLVSSEEGLIVMGAATGLPWAAALGRLIAERISVGRADLWSTFRPGRAYPVSPRLQRVIGAQAAFAVSHGVKKLLQGL